MSDTSRCSTTSSWSLRLSSRQLRQSSCVLDCAERTVFLESFYDAVNAAKYDRRRFTATPGASRPGSERKSEYCVTPATVKGFATPVTDALNRSEEHTSELQSLRHL